MRRNNSGLKPFNLHPDFMHFLLLCFVLSAYATDWAETFRIQRYLENLDIARVSAKEKLSLTRTDQKCSRKAWRHIKCITAGQALGL